MNVIFDATILGNQFERTSMRSGIFFVAKNILDNLLLKKDVRVLLYFSPENVEQSFHVYELFYSNVGLAQSIQNFKLLIYLKSWLMKLYRRMEYNPFVKFFPAAGVGFLDCLIRKICNRISLKKECAESWVFFSPIYKIPESIRKLSFVKPVVLLHDAIPILCPEMSDASFAEDVCRSTLLTDVILYNSLHTRSDFERLFPILKRCRNDVSYLAASSVFSVQKDESLLKLVKAKYGLPEQKKYVFSLCNLAPHKNLERCLRSFKFFTKKNSIDDIVWVLGGSPHCSMYDFMNRVGLDYNSKLIKCIGYVNDADLPILYSNAEWFVYTSQYEGFGLPPLEAMQCGCPVIVSNNTSLPEVVGDAGLLIDWDSDEQHIWAYEKYYFDENMRKEYSKKGLERAKLFSWTKTVDQLINIVSEV